MSDHRRPAGVDPEVLDRRATLRPRVPLREPSGPLADAVREIFERIDDLTPRTATLIVQNAIAQDRRQGVRVESASPLDTQAIEIARRARVKLEGLFGPLPSGIRVDAANEVDFWDALEAVFVAEIVSRGGTPPDGAIDLRLGYAEAVQLVTCVVESDSQDLTASERDILAELRRKFYRALGVAIEGKL